MLLNEVMLALSLVLLFCLRGVVSTAVKNRDTARARVFNIFRLGLTLSACSFLIHSVRVSPLSLLSLLSFFFCLAGTLLIWIGWMELVRLHAEIRKASPDLDQENAPDTQIDAVLGDRLPRFDSQTRGMLRHASAEARQQRQCCINTDHLLLGLLARPSRGAEILDRLGVARRQIRQALGRAEKMPSVDAEYLPVSEHARQVFMLAAQEAHRFDAEVVGTDHILLGLVLAGTGAAAVALFQAGATVDGIRDEIVKSRVARRR